MEYIEKGKILSLRFTDSEAEFINENYELIAGTPERIIMRDFFFKAVSAAVSMVAPKVAEKARPEDVAEIHRLKSETEALEAETLRLQTLLTQTEADIESKTAFISEITGKNAEYDTELDRLREQLDDCLAKERPTEEGSLLLENMTEEEQALAGDYARMMECTPKQLLVERLFVPTVLYGPGDYIPQLKDSVRRQLKKAFKR